MGTQLSEVRYVSVFTIFWSVWVSLSCWALLQFEFFCWEHFSSSLLLINYICLSYHYCWGRYRILAIQLNFLMPVNISVIIRILGPVGFLWGLHMGRINIYKDHINAFEKSNHHFYSELFEFIPFHHTDIWWRRKLIVWHIPYREMSFTC